MNALMYRILNDTWMLHPDVQPSKDEKYNLVLVFGAKDILQKEGIYDMIKAKFPEAQVALCSTAGEIFMDEVLDQSLIVVALSFEHTPLHASSVNIQEFDNTYSAAIALAKLLPQKNLSYVMILSDGSLVNGSELVKGLSSQINKNVLITGGLAGDGSDFNSTLVGLNEHPKEGKIVAIGFYGNRIKVTHGSQGGWDIFGLEKRVTNSSANVLVELEEQNALDIYKKYLGKDADKLPGSALLFPLSVTIPGSSKPVVRTILSINENDKTMNFAGDIPVGSKVRFMKANFDRLTMAAAEAAENTMVNEKAAPGFSLLISCVGRKIIMGTKTNEEVKAVSNFFDHKTMLAGFYAYGEISPFNEGGCSQLHNQTMTITSFFEK